MVWRIARAGVRALTTAAIVLCACARVAAQPTARDAEAALLARTAEMMRAGRLDSARDAAQQAVAAYPESARAHDQLGFVLGLQGSTDEAIAEFRRAIALQPALADAQYHLGATLWWTK